MYTALNVSFSWKTLRSAVAVVAGSVSNNLINAHTALYNCFESPSALRNKNSSGDEIANVLVNDDIAHT